MDYSSMGRVGLARHVCPVLFERYKVSIGTDQSRHEHQVTLPLLSRALNVRRTSSLVVSEDGATKDSGSISARRLLETSAEGNACKVLLVEYSIG